MIASEQSERGILSLLIRYPERTPEAMFSLTPDDFYINRYKSIYERLVCLFEKKIQPCEATIYQEGIVQSLDDIDIFDSHESPDILPSYISHVLECSETRRINSMPEQIKQISSSSIPNEEKIEKILSVTNSIVLQKNNITDYTMSAICSTYKEYLQRVQIEGCGVKTGIKMFDEMTGGVEKSNVIVIAGNPGEGKSLIAQNVGLNMALAGQGVCFVSYEMNSNETLNRLVSNLSGVPSYKIRTGLVDAGQKKKLSEALDRLEQTNFLLMTGGGINLNQIKRTIINSKFKVDNLFIDYLQIVPIIKSSGNQTQDISKLVYDIKNMSAHNELDLCSFLLSQLSRDNTRRTEKGFKNSDLRDSGQIEAVASIIMFVEKNNGYINLYITKNRNGHSSGTEPLQIPVDFNLQQVR